MTVEQVGREAKAAYQRGQILREMIDLLDLRYGRHAEGDPEFLRTAAGGYERPQKQVVEQLRLELVAAWSRAFDKYKALCAAAVLEVDEGLLGDVCAPDRPGHRGGKTRRSRD